VLAMVLPLRGTVALFQQDLMGARTYLQRAAYITRDLPNQIALGRVYLTLGQLALLEDNIRDATDRFLEVLGIAAHTGGRSLLCDSLDGLAFVAATRGDEWSAVRLLAAVDRMRVSIKQARAPDDQRQVDATLAHMRDTMGVAAFDSDWRIGQQLSLDEAIACGRNVGLDPHLEAVPRSH
jgi:hypothetical protein